MNPSTPRSCAIVLLTSASLLLGALPARADEAPPPAAQAPPAPAGGKGSAEAGPAGLEVVWHRTWDEALDACKKIKDGRILVYFNASECGDCQRMEALIFPSTSFWSFMRGKVALSLDRGSLDGRRLAERFGIEAVPTWIVVTPDLVVSGLQVGPTSQQTWFETFAQTEKSWAQYRKKLENEQRNPGELAVVFDVAQETFKRRGDALAEPRFKRIANDPKAPAPLREQSLAYLASIHMDSGQLEEATSELDTLASTATDPTLRDRALVRRAEVEIARGRKDKAIARLRDFQKAHPTSTLGPEVEELLRALSQGRER